MLKSEILYCQAVHKNLTHKIETVVSIFQSPSTRHFHILKIQKYRQNPFFSIILSHPQKL